MKPTFLELRHLRTLLALKETGSVSMAAKRVYLTQSALSHQIKLMEEQFGLPLFERKSNPLRFTAAGDRLIRLANEILPLANKEVWQAEDFAEETWVTYPVPDDMLDLYRQVLKPKGINPPRRTTELTIALIQLVASRRGIATVPYWAALPYLEKGYVVARKITEEGLYSNLYAAIRKEDANLAYIEDFHQTVKAQSFSTLPGLSVLEL